MVKTKGPALSAEASGSLARSLTFAKNNKRSSAKAYSAPPKRTTQKQWYIRVMNKFLCSQWKTFSTAEQATWIELAELRRMAPYHAYLSENMKRWANERAPSKTYPATEAGPVPGNVRPNLYTGWHHFDCKSLLGGLANIWGWTFAYKQTGVPYPPGPLTIQTIKAYSFPPRQLWKELDLLPGWYLGYFRTFSPTGLWAPWTSAVGVLVT